MCAKSIEIIVGPMFSGKSTELIRRCNNYEAIGFNVLIINHVLDTRCEQIAYRHIVTIQKKRLNVRN